MRKGTGFPVSDALIKELLTAGVTGQKLRGELTKRSNETDKKFDREVCKPEKTKLNPQKEKKEHKTRTAFAAVKK